MKRLPDDTMKLVIETGKDLSKEFWIMVMERFLDGKNGAISQGMITSILIAFLGQTCILYKDMYEDSRKKANPENMLPTENIEIVLMSKLINAMQDMKKLSEAHANEKLK